ncbi:MAG: nucleotidyltransferase family protein [Chloroflexi bacterium]|nr:nucleotidyltransferase family protein [Chloroflexota bacterium]
MTVAAILLAAGASQRMGTPKALLPWGDRTLLVWELDELLRSSVDDIVLVTGAHADVIRRSLGDGARFCVFNPRWAQGRAGSLAAGAHALRMREGPPPAAILVQSVDQPTRHDIIDRVLDELRDSDAQIVQPTYNGRAGHPVALAGSLLEELSEVREDTLGLRAIVERHPPRLLPMDDEPVVQLILNTPDTLDHGRRLLGVAGD